MTDRTAVRRLLTRLLAARAVVDGIVAAYLFGSVARGTHRPGSDVDVAVLCRRAPAPTFDALPRGLEGDSERRLARPTQVIALNTAPVDLRVRVLRDGLLLLDRDPLAMYRIGRQHAVPLITGLNGNEGSLMTRGMDIAAAAAFEEYVRSVYPEVAGEMLAHYDASSPEAAKAAIDKVIRGGGN